jgi:hypothetical protein
VLPLAVAEDEALRRLQGAIEGRTSLEHLGLGEEVGENAARLFIPSPSDRRVGSASSDAVNLAVQDAERSCRRKSWNMQFRGRVESSDGASFLRGVVEIREWRRLRWMLPLLRALAVLPILFGLFPTARVDIGNVQPLRVIATVVLTIAIWLVLARMQEEGERAAAAMLDSWPRTCDPNWPSPSPSGKSTAAHIRVRDLAPVPALGSRDSREVCAGQGL